MRRLSRLVMILSIVAGAAPVLAQTPEGETPPAKPIAGYDGGFFIQNSEGDFKLKINGRLQPQYFFEKGKVGGISVAGAPVNAESISTFKIRRARVTFSGDLGKKWSFVSWLQNSTSSGQTPNTLYWWADVTYNPSPLFKLEMGSMQAPMDRFNQTSSATYLMIEGPLTATQKDGIQDLSISRPAFGTPSSLGIQISGKVKNRFIYMLGVTNGSNPTGNSEFTSNFNKRMSAGARLQYNILKDPGYSQSDLAWSESPALALGAGVSYNDQGGADAYAPTIYLRYNLQGSSDLAFKYKGLSLTFEWYGRIQYCSSLGTNTNFTLQDAGYYALAGYFLIPKKLEIGAESAQIFREGPHNDSQEFLGTVNWYILGNSIKWQNSGGLVRDYDAVDSTQGQRRWRVWSMITMNI